MCRKVIFVTSVVLVLGMVGSASAEEYDWVGGTDNDNWCEATNWSPSGPPDGPGDQAGNGDTPPEQGPVIGAGCDANVGSISLPGGSVGQHMEITGGTLICHGTWRWSNDGDSNGTVTISGGDVNVHGEFRWADTTGGYGIANFTNGAIFNCTSGIKLGDNGGGEIHVSGAATELHLGKLELKLQHESSTLLFNMSGGLIDIVNSFSMGDGDMSPGAIEVNFDSGYIICNNFSVQDGDEPNDGPGTMDFEEGAILEIRGDVLVRMQSYIDAGFFTGKDDTEDPVTALIGGHTFVGFDLSQLEASKPVPTSGTGGICPGGGLTLTWDAGDEADQHKIFFGTSFEDVNEMTDPCQINGIGDETYETGPLEYGQGYYWRVDEVNIADACTWRGSVWSFSTDGGTAREESPPSGRRGLPPGDIDLSWTFPCQRLTGQTLYYGTDFPQSIVLFDDDFDQMIRTTTRTTTTWPRQWPGP
ncbi:MAG: hypothetical protein ACYST6_17575 [Planctomycetota bacterium]